ncbi:hypothetical protein AAZX31_09G172300 [Glycine max]|uniref:Uncharacterized protein n=2 Tax=Glycine subgen. Soja TaxID=1462606 RepID=K7LER7_SOYBN|nr:hypothetical protein JHK87_025513 [Glycine soja]KAG5013440.1 hypothetical protein JHK86_025701 [Glycine max]KAG5134387.1 hypothetical protein JHK82_025575 [Glycine max]KAH1043701.1 hypothetical protein GYH30_025518 [Glycine max]KHN45655.1 hypothetical protein glysoja_031526 [Glycine soja]
MCHPGIPFVNREGLMVHRRWLVSSPLARQIHDGGSSGESGSVQRCVCSPSQHPGSFRCRLHHVKYVWCGRTIK